MSEALEKKLIEALHRAQEKENKEEEISRYLDLAQLHYNNKNFEKAKRNLLNILSLDQSYINIRYYLALIELNNGNNDKASKYLKEEIKFSPNNQNAKELLSKLEISSNFPTITLSFLLLFIFSYITLSFPQITYETLLKFTLFSENLNLLKLLNSIIVHSNFYHFLFNSIALLIFGLALEKIIGSTKFFFIFISSALIGNFLEAILTIEPSFILGASGGVFGILGAILMRTPLLSLKVLGIIKVPLILLTGFLFGTYVLVSELLQNIIAQSGEFAHLFGFLTGMFLVGVFYSQTISNFYYWVLTLFGFWIMSTFALNIIQLQVLSSLSIIYLVGSLLVGVYLISFSYFKLKQKYEIKN